MTQREVPVPDTTTQDSKVDAQNREWADSTERLAPTDRVLCLREATLSEDRYLSVEQALIITRSYRTHPDAPRAIRRAHALADSLREITIRIDPQELIVGNRTPGIRAGVVFPEAGIGWVARELDTLPTRPQDPFLVRPEDAAAFRSEIFPEWDGDTLEDHVARRLGQEIAAIGKVVKINQTDHAQGHIIPDVQTWLSVGPAGLRERVLQRLPSADAVQKPFLEAAIIVLDAARDFMRRYSEMARESRAVAEVCERLADSPPCSFHEALQSVWFLFVILQMESNASSFSPGRLDQVLLPFLMSDLESGALTIPRALELLEALWIKFNQIVYMRSAESAQYFAGFPIGFNVAVGGMDREGRDATNLMSYLILKAQEHLGLSQPNLTARLWSGSPGRFVDECARVIGLGSGMPQIVNDESIVPALINRGIAEGDARDYGVVGCVELSTQGNVLGWSDAAMFNLVKALELALNNGRCLLSGRQMGPKSGTLADFKSFDEVEAAFRTQVDHFCGRMIPLCDAVDRLHTEILPSPFLSTVISDCIDRGRDVTAGGARYNLSGIQAIQVANVADSLAAIKHLVFDTRQIPAGELLDALRGDYRDHPMLRERVITRAPKYGNDVAWVDELGARWVAEFAETLAEHTNARGGPYHMGLYTVSAHVPMGKNVGASADGRHAGDPLADGGVSAMLGRDLMGPTALLRSVARLDFAEASNGSLLNMKFLPRTFTDPEERTKFVALLRAIVRLGIHHAQFNVVDRETLLAAKARPELYRSLTIRVAGYTAYFAELAEELQDEIIGRTTYGM